MTADPIDALVDSLHPDCDTHDFDGSWASTYARRILTNPQAHIDALVEAGVLKSFSWIGYPADTTCLMDDGSQVKVYGRTAYLIPEPPHVHVWVVNRIPIDPRTHYPDHTRLLLLCGCGAEQEVENRWPGEVPE